MSNASSMTKPPPEAAAAGETAWFVQAAGEVWGPYNRARVERFVVEGRVTPHSLLAAQIEGPFQPAGRWRSLSALFQTPPIKAAKPYQHQPAPPSAAAVVPPTGALSEAVAAPSSQPAPQPAPRMNPPQVSQLAAKLQPLLIWADLTSMSAPQFEGLLGRYGALAAIRSGVWLLQARCAPATLRNALSRRLTGADALMIVHAPLDQAAWFNLDSTAERGLRQLWGGAV